MICITLLAFLATLVAREANGFAPSNLGSSHIKTFSRSPQMTALKMAEDGNDEVAKLMAAAAKAREEAARLARELGKEDTESSKSTTATLSKTPKKNPEEVMNAINAIDFSASASLQISALDELRKDGYLSLYKSATAENGSGDLRSYPVSLNMLESRSGLTSEKLGIGVEEVSLDDFKYGTLYVTGGCSVLGVAALAFLPENVGATVCYLVAVIPILWLGIGSTAPAVIANLISAVKGGGDDTNKVDRVCRHEAAHFLCGYLCGLPIANYATTDENIPRVEFHYSADGPATASRELTEDEVNALTVVAMSGSVAEAMEFGKAGGANSDLMELQNIFRQSKDFLGAEKQQSLTRWGALTAYRLINANKDKLDSLCDAFSEQKSIAECVAILER
ncbi:peptidase M41 family protein [Nitzschia inconspicua]|uniref:Peptidase M41 family protein n=1 Tax=Nitzschia inconspicua TaxID=303405 RepID=A0A9K3PR07_9STRA|nr:peptidase M41 family protein [Nitzschia inconspicua]